MESIESFADQRHDSSCLQCRKALDSATATRDHIPSKSLLQKPYPPNLPVFPICEGCNNRLSKDEEYLRVFLECAARGTCDPEELPDGKVARALSRNAQLHADMRSARKTFDTLGGQQRTVWTPDLARLVPPLLKNALGHFAYELSERPIGDPAHMGVAPLSALSEAERAAFEDVDIGDGWPEVGSRMMTRLVTGQDLVGSWIMVQSGRYRYAIHQYSAVRIVVHEFAAFEVVWK